MITYEDLAAGLEDAWLMAGLHEHTVLESILPESLERMFRAEVFPEHPEPLNESNAPPWVELSFTWTPAHQLHASGRELPPGALELAWTYTVDVRSGADRPDQELIRAFQAAVRGALRRILADINLPSEYIAVEVRRGYRSSGDRYTMSYTQLVGTNVTDLSDVWENRNPDVLREVLREELMIVAALLHALAETFAPGGIGGYRSVETA